MKKRANLQVNVGLRRRQEREGLGEAVEVRPHPVVKTLSLGGLLHKLLYLGLVVTAQVLEIISLDGWEMSKYIRNKCNGVNEMRQREG